MRRLDGCYEHMTGPYKFRVAYKRTPEQYVPFLSNTDGDYLESDFSANDMKQCQDVMRLEMMLMRRLGCPEWFIRLHTKTNLFTVGNAKHGVKAELEHQLPTGCTDTTFRNTFWNSCILYTFLVNEKATRCRALLLGDDMLARVSGLKRNAAARYTSLAADARMVAKVSRHRNIADCGFLSKVFIPRINAPPAVMPLPGKALGRFNVRANSNEAVTDHAYFAAKAIGYAYEFRFVPVLRDIFFDRFNYECPLALAEKHALRFVGDDSLSWSAREAGVTLQNIKSKLMIAPEWEIHLEDLNTFTYYRYGLLQSEFVSLFENVVLSTEHCDVHSFAVDALVRDFAT